MFTGIIQDVGRILALEALGGDTRLTVGVDRLDLSRCANGDSIAVAGVCLTAIEFELWFVHSWLVGGASRTAPLGEATLCQRVEKNGRIKPTGGET